MIHRLWRILGMLPSEVFKLKQEKPADYKFMLHSELAFLEEERKKWSV